MRPSGAGVRLVIAIALASFAFAAQAQVVRTWVSTAGIDNPGCGRSSPCRSFSAAIAAVDAGGEVVALDSGGYGAFTITKAVTVLAPNGIHAAISPTAGYAITVDAGALNEVRLVNLQLTSHGAHTGIWLYSGAALSVEGCAIDGFGTGIVAQTGRTTVSRSAVLNAAEWGMIVISYGEVTRAAISDARFEGNGTGAHFDTHTRGMISDSIFTENQLGVTVGSNIPGGTDVSIEGCTLFQNTSRGISAGGSSGGGALSMRLRLSNTTIVGSPAGIEITNSAPTDGVVYSLGNNMIHGNSTDVFGGTLTMVAPR